MDEAHTAQRFSTIGASDFRGLGHDYISGYFGGVAAGVGLDGQGVLAGGPAQPAKRPVDAAVGGGRTNGEHAVTIAINVGKDIDRGVRRRARTIHLHRADCIHDRGGKIVVRPVSRKIDGDAGIGICDCGTINRVIGPPL